MPPSSARSRTRKVLIVAGTTLAIFGAYTATTSNVQQEAVSVVDLNMMQMAFATCSFNDGDLIALQADTGKFVARCNGCIPGGAYPDSAFVHA
ncbi:hypothetical protein THRCLA_22973, partial [Thraustotheca clavata]